MKSTLRLKFIMLYIIFGFLSIFTPVSFANLTKRGCRKTFVLQQTHV